MKAHFTKLWNKSCSKIDQYLFSQKTQNETIGLCDGEIITYREFEARPWRLGRVWIAQPSDNNVAVAYRNQNFDRWAAFFRGLKQ